MATAAATRTSEPLALRRPFEPSPFNVFEIDFIVPLNIASIIPMATSDFVISPTSSSARAFIDAERMPIAIAMATIDDTLMPSAKEDKVS